MRFFKTWHALAVVAFACFTGPANAGQNYRELAGEIPHPFEMAFLEYAEKYVAERAAADECPLSRKTTVYIAQNAAGNSTGGAGAGTVASPYLCNTLDDVTTFVNANQAVGKAFLFKRGDVYRGTGGFALSTDDQTLAGYGTGRAPQFRRVTQVSSGWTLSSGTKYTRTASTVAWVLLPAGDGYIRLPLARQTSAANVPTTIAGTGGTWHHASTTLTMDVGVNPNTINVEIVTDNTENGVLVTSDGCRVDSLEFVGFGMNTGTPASQATPLRFSGTDTEACLFTNCRAYYGSTHVIAQYTAGKGGFLAVAGCEYAWAIPNTSVTLLNGYASSGGNEFVCLDCRCVGGQLPAGTAPTAGIAASIYGHTDGGAAYMALSLAQRCTQATTAITPFTTHTLGWGSPPPAGYSLPAFRAFWLEMDCGTSYTYCNQADNLFANCWHTVTVSGTGVVAYNAIDDKAYWINHRLVANIMAANTSGITNFTFANTAQANDAHRDHCGIWYTGDTTTTIWFDRRLGLFAEEDPRVNRLCTMVNLTPSGNVLASWGNDPAINFGCCYYSVGSSTDAAAGYDQDANDITLDDPFPVEARPTTGSQVNRTGLASIGLKYDCLGRPRGNTVTAGPFAARYVLDERAKFDPRPFEGPTRLAGDRLRVDWHKLALAQTFPENASPSPLEAVGTTFSD